MPAVIALSPSTATLSQVNFFFQCPEIRFIQVILFALQPCFIVKALITNLLFVV
jgi:hypothetical protein